MNVRVLLLIASIVANAVLLAAVTNRSMHWTGRFSSPPASPASAAGAATPNPAAAGKVAIDPKTWQKLSLGDPAAVAAQLKAEGFPVSLQRVIVGALVAGQFADRHRALAALIDAEPWWRGNLYGTKSGAKIMALRQQLTRDETEAVDRILGAESGLSDYKRAQNQHQFGDLPPERMSELARIEADYAEMAREVRNAGNNIILPEDREKLALLEREKRADISKLLTPDELFEYDLRSSRSAGQLRSQLTAFNPTEDEFRALFKLQQAFDAKYGGDNLDALTAEQRRARAIAQADLLKQAEGTLSPDRYAELKEKTDPMYLNSNAFVTRMQLPATVTAEIVAVQKDIHQRATQVRNDTNLTPAERAVRLSSLADEANLRLTPTLGQDGLNAYRQSAGSWINYLKQQPTSVAPKR